MCPSSNEYTLLPALINDAMILYLPALVSIQFQSYRPSAKLVVSIGLVISVPPKYFVSEVARFLRAKSAAKILKYTRH
jgi:hypothetical protein